MLGSIKEEHILGKKVFIYLPPSYKNSGEKFPVLYSHDGQDLYRYSENLINNLEEEFEKGNLQEFIWIGIYANGKKRHHEYTPWPAPALDPKFDDFGGLGELYIDFIVNELKTYIDDNYNTKSDYKNTWIMGYSLGGLISVYSAYRTPIFGKIACICGSFWYKDMVNWIKDNSILNNDVKLFIHYGKQEGKGKKTIQQNAVLCAEKVIEIISEKSDSIGNLEVSYDDGEHHQYVEQRYKNAIYWVSNK